LPAEELNIGAPAPWKDPGGQEEVPVAAGSEPTEPIPERETDTELSEPTDTVWPRRQPKPSEESPVRPQPRVNLTARTPPTHGWRGLLWKLGGSRLYSRFGWEWLVKLSLRDRYDIALNELWKLRKVQKTIAMVNSKGGAGKTALTVWLASFYAFAISRHVLVFDANENAGGNPANRLGIRGKSDNRSADEGTIELRDYLKKCESGEINDLQTLTDHVQWNRETGVSVISSERRASQRFSQESFMKGLRVAKRLSHAVFCDLGNDVYGTANFGSILMSDTLVFPANVNMADSLHEVSDTMEKYRQRGQESRYGEFDVHKKIDNAIIVILGAKQKERAVYAKRYNYPIEQVFVVPFNRYMANNTNQVHLTRVPLSIRVIMLEILVAISKAGSGQASLRQYQQTDSPTSWHTPAATQKESS